LFALQWRPEEKDPLTNDVRFSVSPLGPTRDADSHRRSSCIRANAHIREGERWRAAAPFTTAAGCRLVGVTMPSRIVRADGLAWEKSHTLKIPTVMGRKKGNSAAVPGVCNAECGWSWTRSTGSANLLMTGKGKGGRCGFANRAEIKITSKTRREASVPKPQLLEGNTVAAAKGGRSFQHPPSPGARPGQGAASRRSVENTVATNPISTGP
jgi:hypothetical protein